LKFAAIMAAGALVVSLSTTTLPVSAYDKGAYGYAASHFLSEKQIPKVFKTKPKGFYVSINPAGVPQPVCGFGAGEKTSVKLAIGLIEAFAGYELELKMNDLTVNVIQYKNNVSAEKAFLTMSKAVKKCDGRVDTSWTGLDGTVYSSDTLTTTGKVPGVTVAGVESVFINLDSNFDATLDNPASINDQRALFTLVNDVIIQSGFDIGTSKNISRAQKKGLEKVAFDMVDSWLN